MERLERVWRSDKAELGANTITNIVYIGTFFTKLFFELPITRPMLP